MSEEETRERTSAILGCPVSDSAWTEAWEKAKRKIRHIAEFCGYDGCREQPGYMAQLAAEYIREAAFSAWTIRERPPKIDDPRTHTNSLSRFLRKIKEDTQWSF